MEPRCYTSSLEALLPNEMMPTNRLRETPSENTQNCTVVRLFLCLWETGEEPGSEGPAAPAGLVKT